MSLITGFCWFSSTSQRFCGWMEGLKLKNRPRIVVATRNDIYLKQIQSGVRRMSQKRTVQETRDPPPPWGFSNHHPHMPKHSTITIYNRLHNTLSSPTIWKAESITDNKLTNRTYPTTDHLWVWWCSGWQCSWGQAPPIINFTNYRLHERCRWHRWFLARSMIVEEHSCRSPW